MCAQPGEHEVAGVKPQCHQPRTISLARLGCSAGGAHPEQPRIGRRRRERLSRKCHAEANSRTKVSPAGNHLMQDNPRPLTSTS